MTRRDDLVNELLEENYDIVYIINLIWERQEVKGLRTSDYELCEAIVGVMTDEEVEQVMNKIEEDREEDSD
jgi:hypothetical protein